VTGCVGGSHDTPQFKGAQGWAWREPITQLSILLLMSLFAGCSLFNQERTEALSRAPADIYSWEARGKVAVTIDSRAETARFVWLRQNPQTDVITLSGPIAMKQATLERRGGTFLRQHGESLQPIGLNASADPLAMALKALPPGSIGNWLLGHASDSDEWQVDVAEWQNSTLWRAPKRVIIRGADLEIRVIISQWAFEPIP